MYIKVQERYGLIKTAIDAHTLGINSAAELLRDCGYSVLISPTQIQYAIEHISSESSQNCLLSWIKDNKISHIGFSYRLDPDTAVDLFARFIFVLKKYRYYECDSPLVKSVFFAGLAPACDIIDRLFDGHIKTFRGGESPEETLIAMGVSLSDIPKQIKEGCKYDNELITFGERIIKSNLYRTLLPKKNVPYSEFGTAQDSIELRSDYRYNFPVIRAHCGPYSSDMSRQRCIKEYCDWCKQLAQAGFLDVLSIGSSQLSQSAFGESWEGKPNGGGVPVNSEQEYVDIWKSARPMLVRTYSGTKDILSLAKMYEKTINISWHALSLWWFDELDGRGPNKLYDNLKEHINTIRYISTTGKPVETNVSHHFAFRGADDLTYIISGFLAAKIAKINGIKTFILQNMLNTPRSTWGVQDLAKGRTLIKLVKELESEQFRVMLQARAGLDYFKPNLETAKVQLSAVTALMDDIDPCNYNSPEIIHVVSFSEALFLANPDIINESIKISLYSLQEYRKLKRKKMTPNVMTDDIMSRQESLEASCRKIIKAMEKYIPNLYTPKGLYLAFTAGWLPVPGLWSNSEEFKLAKEWQSRPNNGGIKLYEDNLIISDDKRIEQCVRNMPEAERIFNYFYIKKHLLWIK